MSLVNISRPSSTALAVICSNIGKNDEHIQWLIVCTMFSATNKSKHSGAQNNDIDIPNNSDSDGDDIDPDLVTTKQNDIELNPNEFSHIYLI